MGDGDKHFVPAGQLGLPGTMEPASSAEQSKLLAILDAGVHLRTLALAACNQGVTVDWYALKRDGSPSLREFITRLEVFEAARREMICRRNMNQPVAQLVCPKCLRQGAACQDKETTDHPGCFVCKCGETFNA